MSATKKILIIIFSLLLIGVLAFLITWGVINFNKVKDLMSGTGIYNKTDVDNAYNDGYNTALKDKDEWDKLLNDYRDTITVQTDIISQLNSDKSALDKSIKDYETQVTNLTEERTDLENQIKLLNEEIASLNDTISDKDGEINDIIAEKQALIEQHTQTVSRLNAQITGLNGQIEELNNKINANAVTVASLNDRITELQGTIAKYQEFIAQFETEDKAVVTFEFAGSVYSVQVVDKGGKVIVETPTSSDYVIFNGWTLNGEAIDLSTYTVTETVRIVADVTYKYVVSFTVNGEVKSTQVIEKGNYVTETPTVRKTGYTFKYWTLDGETEVHFEQLPITANTTFIAKFNQLHSVDFTYDNGENIINTKKVEHGMTTTAPRVTLNDGDVLNGWRVNGVAVDVGSYVINSDTVFVADITHKHKVVFMVDDTEYSVQYVENGGIATVTIPVKDGYQFVGWTVDGTNIVDINTFNVAENITFIAKFMLYRWEKISLNGPSGALATFTYENNAYYVTWVNSTVGHVCYKLDVASNTWVEAPYMLPCQSLDGRNYWTDGYNLYFSDGLNNRQYIYNSSTQSWSNMVWNGFSDINGMHVWFDGSNYYYSVNQSSNSVGRRQYVLDVSTHTWSTMTWNGLTCFDGDDVWTDGTNCFVRVTYPNRKYYALNKSSNTWVEISWFYTDGNEFDMSPASGRFWTDSLNNTYISYYNYSLKQYEVLLVDTNNYIVSPIVFDDLPLNSSFSFWTIGEDCYCLVYSSSDGYSTYKLFVSYD